MPPTTLPPTVAAALDAIKSGKSGGELETTTLDFKEPVRRSQDDTIKRVVDASLCFANSAGGSVILGVSDKQRGPEAFVGTDLDERHLQKRIWELTDPHLLVQVTPHSFDGVRLLHVDVVESPEIHADTQGRAPRRIGTDCHNMSPQEQRLAREERQGIDWSAQASTQDAPELSPSALALARTYLRQLPDRRRELADLADDDLLRALGVVTAEGELLRAGELLFCDASAERETWIVYQFRETSGGEPRAVDRPGGSLLEAFAATHRAIAARSSETRISLPGGQEFALADFPAEAVDEALANAIIHRDYHSREPVHVEHSREFLTVVSPGPLVSGVTRENILTHPSRPRNPLLARAVRHLGLAEEIGRGVDRMYREMIRSGKEVPDIDPSIDAVRVTLFGSDPNTQVARYVAQLPEAEREDTDTLLVLSRLRGKRTTNAADMAPLMQKGVEQAEVVLRRLATDAVGMIEPTKRSAGRRNPDYAFRGAVLQALGTSVSYHRPATDETDRKVIALVESYGKVTNRVLQQVLNVDVQRAKAIITGLAERGILVKTTEAQRGPGVEWGPGPKFPRSRSRKRSGSG